MKGLLESMSRATGFAVPKLPGTESQRLCPPFCCSSAVLTTCFGRTGKSLFSRSAKIVEERRVGLVQYLKTLFASFPAVLEDDLVANFFDLINRLASEATVAVSRPFACHFVVRASILFG